MGWHRAQVRRNGGIARDLQIGPWLSVSAINGLRGSKGRTGLQGREPGCERRRRFTPAERFEPIVEIAERATDRHVPYREGRTADRRRLGVEQLQAGMRLELERIRQGLQRKLPFALVAPEDQC